MKLELPIKESSRFQHPPYFDRIWTFTLNPIDIRFEGQGFEMTLFAPSGTDYRLGLCSSAALMVNSRDYLRSKLPLYLNGLCFVDEIEGEVKMRFPTSSSFNANKDELFWNMVLTLANLDIKETV